MVTKSRDCFVYKVVVINIFLYKIYKDKKWCVLFLVDTCIIRVVFAKRLDFILLACFYALCIVLNYAC